MKYSILFFTLPFLCIMIGTSNKAMDLDHDTYNATFSQKHYDSWVEEYLTLYPITSDSVVGSFLITLCNKTDRTKIPAAQILADAFDCPKVFHALKSNHPSINIQPLYGYARLLQDVTENALQHHLKVTCNDRMPYYKRPPSGNPEKDVLIDISYDMYLMLVSTIFTPEQQRERTLAEEKRCHQTLLRYLQKR